MTDAPKQTVTIKKYANRRLYNTATSAYVTLEQLSQLVKEGTEFNVYDAKTGEDITRSVLTQIIVEEEGKSGQQNLLPISFLRQLIGFYGDNMQWMVPKYLEQSMQMLSSNQEQLRNYMQTTFGSNMTSMFPFGSAFEEMGKQNMAMFEKAMRMFSSFTSPAAAGNAAAQTASAADAAAAHVIKTATSATTSAVKTASDAALQVARAGTTAAMKTATAATGAMDAADDDEEPAPAVAGSIWAPPSTLPSQDATPMASVTSIKRDSDKGGDKPAAASASPATPMANVQSAVASAAPSADDMQQKIANLQRQLADLAKGRG